MYRIGIIGHDPTTISEPISETIKNTLDVLKFQYGEDNVVFNIPGRIGVGIWAAQSALELGLKYHVFLPYSIEETSQHWYSDQKSDLNYLCGRAYSITSCYPSGKQKDESMNLLVDGSSFVVCFWNGKRQGKTYEAILHAHKTNKLVVNALNNLRLVTGADTSKRKNH